jgi:hypothetical protein
MNLSKKPTKDYLHDCCISLEMTIWSRRCPECQGIMGATNVCSDQNKHYIQLGMHSLHFIGTSHLGR